MINDCSETVAPPAPQFPINHLARDGEYVADVRRSEKPPPIRGRGVLAREGAHIESDLSYKTRIRAKRRGRTKRGMIPGVPIYISLMKWTSQGIGGLPGWRDRMEEGDRAIRERGGKLLAAYVTLGRFDMVEIFEAPDDETAYQCVIAVARHGNVTTETLRAFTRDEAESLVKVI